MIDKDDIDDRTVFLIIVGTGFAGLFAWWSGLIEAELGGLTEMVVRGFLVLLFFAIMVGAWWTFKSMD
jgi:hypothetical protein